MGIFSPFQRGGVKAVALTEESWNPKPSNEDGNCGAKLALANEAISFRQLMGRRSNANGERRDVRRREEEQVALQDNFVSARVKFHSEKSKMSKHK